MGTNEFTALTMIVNGRKVELPIDERESLCDVLRNWLGLTSVKRGCEAGECGACTVLVGGMAVNSCIYLAVWAEGKSVITVEGLTGKDGSLHPAQQAFIDEAAIQCGFCTPGFIMTAIEIAGSGGRYTKDEIRALISGHLCRCTGYMNIINAIYKYAGGQG